MAWETHTSSDDLKRIFQVAALALVIGLGSTNSAFPQRAIPEDNLAYPILITVGPSFGTGFLVNDTKSIFLATAKHVLFNPPQNQSDHSQKWSLLAPTATLVAYPRSATDFPARFVLTLDLNKLTAQGDLKGHPSEDVALVKLGAYNETPPTAPPQPLAIPSPTTPPPAASARAISFVEGVTVNEQAPSGLVSVNVTTSAKTFDQVLVGNDVLLFGYPVSLALEPNPKIDFSRPLLRRGIVAGEDVPQHSIILDCPSYQGDSGSPVIEVDVSAFQRQYWLIGVMNSFVPFRIF
jgi:Trypsin-like peptidase domain